MQNLKCKVCSIGFNAMHEFMYYFEGNNNRIRVLFAGIIVVVCGAAAIF